MARIRKPTVKVVLMKHKKLTNGEHPIALRITFSRRSKYFVLKNDSGTITSTYKKWNHEFGRYNRNQNQNYILNEYETRAFEVLNSLAKEQFTFSKFEDLYFESNVTSTRVIDYLNRRIHDLELENRLGTAQSYKDTRNRLIEFIGKRSIYFPDLDKKFIINFERFLKENGNNINTIGIYLRTFRAVINSAINDNYATHDDYPFKNFKIKTTTTVKRALTKESMLKLMNLKLKADTSEFHSINFFIFSYLCRGMNFKDMTNLQWDKNIENDTLCYIRAKTANTRTTLDAHRIKIEPEIAEILSIYSKNDPYIFPVLEPGLSEKTKRGRIKNCLKIINKDLKKVSKKLKIPEADEVTFYWARHTFATVLKYSGVSIAVISEVLGHKDEKTTQAYLDKFDNEVVDATYKNLI